MLLSKRCPAGRYCLSGLSGEPLATDCITAKYCPEGISKIVKVLPCVWNLQLQSPTGLGKSDRNIEVTAFSKAKSYSSLLLDVLGIELW